MEKNKKHIEKYNEMLNEIKVSDLLKYISDKIIFTKHYRYNLLIERIYGESKKCYFKYDRIKDNIRSSETKRKLIFVKDMTLGEIFPRLYYISHNIKRHIVSNNSLMKYIVSKGYIIFYSENMTDMYIVHGIEEGNFCSNDKTNELKKVKDKLYSIRTEIQRLSEIENKYKRIERGIENHIEIHDAIYSKSLNLY